MFYRWIPFLVVFSTFIHTIYEKITTNHNIFFSLIDFNFGDKISHLLFYGFLGFLLNYALYFKEFNIKIINFQIGSFCILIFSTIEEFSQLYFINRTFDYFDMIFNLTGVVIFSFLHKIKKI